MNPMKAMSWTGTHNRTIDAAGRLGVPAAYRRALSAGGGRVVLTPALDDCLIVYAPDDWREFTDRLGRLQEFDPAIEEVHRYYIDRAVTRVIDDAGCIRLPAELRKHAQVDRVKDILWVGAGRFGELWNPKVWRTAQRRRPVTRESTRLVLVDL